MIGPDKATMHILGKKNPMYMLNLPQAFIRELLSKGVQIEHLDRFRVWIEPTGQKAFKKPNAFKRKEILNIGSSHVVAFEMENLGRISAKRKGTSFQRKKGRLENMINRRGE